MTAQGRCDIGRPSIDPELMIRMLIVGYCYGISGARRCFVCEGRPLAPYGTLATSEK